MGRSISHRLKAAALSTLIIGTLASVGLAQDHDRGHASHGGEHRAVEGGSTAQGHSGDAMHAADPAASSLPGSPATEAYRAANMAMHSAMEIEFSGDADIDFARGMIGHHQGAIDMARIVLEHGQDADLRHLAEEIIAAQEAEIAFLRDWIADHAPE